MASDSSHRLAALEAERDRLATVLDADPTWRELRALEQSGTADVAAVGAAREVRRQSLETQLAGHATFAAWRKLGEAITLLSGLSTDGGVHGGAPPATGTDAGAAKTAGSDDLTRIRGIDRELSAQLVRSGVTRFADIACWTREDVRRVRDALGVGRRVSREQWIEQAAILATGVGTAFAPTVATVATTAPVVVAAPAPATRVTPVVVPASARSVATAQTGGASVSREPPAAIADGTTASGAGTGALFSRAPLPGQRRSLLAAIEAAEEAARQKRVVPGSAAPMRAAPEQPPERGGAEGRVEGGSTSTAGVAAGGRGEEKPAVVPGRAKPSAFGRLPQSEGSGSGTVPTAAAQTRSAADATRRAVHRPAQDGDGTRAQGVRRIVVDEFAPIEDASVGWDDDTGRNRESEGAASVEIVGEARAVRPSRPSVPRPAGRPRADDAGQVTLSPHVGVHEEAMVEIVHRGESAVRRPPPAPTPVPASVSAPASRLSTFGRLFRGRTTAT